MPLEGATHVLEPPAPVVAHLRRCRPRAVQTPRCWAEGKSPAQLIGQQLGLVEASLPQAEGMKWHRDHPPRRDPFHRQAFGHQLGKRFRKTPPALVLEAMDSQLDRTLICHR